MMLLTLQDFPRQDPAEFLYTLSAACLEHTERLGDTDMACLNDEQHTLTAYCYLDSQVQEGGFVQLIAEGYGEYIFNNPLADSLRRWRIKPTPKILDQAKSLYQKHGGDIEKLSENGTPLDEIRKQFPEFEELDGDYYETADTDLAAAAGYVAANWAKFAELAE
ncbi:DMP19 family protein [Neisseria sp. ZJ106]|nr:DMP19 family protein [Neisseria lisongii]